MGVERLGVFISLFYAQKLSEQKLLSDGNCGQTVAGRCVNRNRPEVSYTNINVDVETGLYM